MNRNEKVGNTIRSPNPIQTGFIELDDFLEGGLKPGDLMVIGGRPSMGATSLALSIVKNKLCEDRVPIVLWLSFSMGYDEFMKRLIISFCRIPLRKYHQFHLLDPREWGQLKDACETVSRMPVYFDMPFDLENIISTVQYHLEVLSEKAGNLFITQVSHPY